MVLLLFQRPAGGSRTEEVSRRSRRSSSRDEEPLTGYGPMSPTFKVPLKKGFLFPEVVGHAVGWTEIKGIVLPKTDISPILY